MTMLLSLGRVLARRMVAQMAWAVSSAGMIPSISVHILNPRSACSSVAEMYSARPVSFNHECSGPTPG
jgi:hypothetical protein